MTGLKIEEKSKLLGTIENLVKLRSALNKEYAPWHQALLLVRDKKIDEAAYLVSKVCDKSSLGDPVRRLIIDEISNLAVINNIDGAGIESLWSTAAGHGYFELAYNAGNQILWRKTNKTVDDYKMASRYFQMAIEGSSNESIKYSAQTNYAEIVREGLITGKKDWLGAIELYEDAGNKGLVNAMFNAGNVLLWLVEAGDKTYSSRAQAWFERIIDHVDSGKSCIDLGGREEAIDRVKSAKIRLASMHLDKLLEKPSMIKAKELIIEYVEDDRVRYMLKRISAEELIFKCKAISKGNHNSWGQVLRANGWSFTEDPIGLQLVPDVDSGACLFQVETHGNYQMTILSFDHFTHHDADVDESYKDIAESIAESFKKPIFIVGKKGFFLPFRGMMFDVLQVMVNGTLEFVPIWPGASSDEVYETLGESIATRFVSGRDDPMNTIPRLVNAIDEGMELNGEELPNAIWLAVSDLLAMPIHRPDEPSRIGLHVTQSVEELRAALMANVSGNL